MSVCCVQDCGSTDNEYLLFDLPLNRSVRKQWLEAIKVSKPSLDAKVCIRHFAERDYDTVRGRTRLRSKVVPTLFNTQITDETSKETSERTNKEAAIDKPNSTDKHKTTDEPTTTDKQEIIDKTKTTDQQQIIDKQNTINQPQTTDKQESTDKLETVDKEKTLDNQEATDKQDPIDNINENEVPTDNKSTNGPQEIDIQNAKSEIEIEPKKERRNKKRKKKRHHRSIDRNKDAESKRCVLENGHATAEELMSLERVESPQLDTSKQDIEDILTNYHIENKKTERQIAAMTVSDNEPDVQTDGQTNQTNMQTNADGFGLGQGPAPVFIEMSVGQGREPGNDCLMLLESVQVDVDPELVLAAAAAAGEGDDIQEHVDLDDSDVEIQGIVTDNKKQDPISLLTSSDESDVILEEPKIDTVEVSDETDEDDMPLVKLLKLKKLLAKKLTPKKKKNNILDYYCIQCGFVTDSCSNFAKHGEAHRKARSSQTGKSKIIQVCQDCGFTTCSKSQLYRHRRKHKNEKKHKCPMCNYSARHNMSLIYHLKTHEKDKNKSVVPIEECNVVLCDVDRRYSCDLCDYTTKRRSDVKRHRSRIHKIEVDFDEDVFAV